LLQGRAAYESEMAKKEIQFLQARQDYEMEKNNMMKSHATKVEKFRMQLDKIQTDKTHLEKLLVFFSSLLTIRLELTLFSNLR
jgi:hypothetical protein